MQKQSKKQKLRKLYEQTKRNANEDFDKVTHERMKRIHAFANKECQDIVARNQFESLDEVSFYRDKFKAIVDIFNESIQQGYRKSKIQQEVKTILSQNYNGSPAIKNESIVAVDKVGKVEKIEKLQALPDPTQSYYQVKKNEINNAKIGINSVLGDVPRTHKKYQIKSKSQWKESQVILPDNTEKINTLNREISKLKKDLLEKQDQKVFNIGALQQQKKEYQNRIADLKSEVRKLNEQNERLKEVQNYAVSLAQPSIPPIYEEEIIEEIEQYNPYRIKYRENDINKIRAKQQKCSINGKYNKSNSVKTYNHPIKQEFNDSKLQSENLDLINELEKGEEKKNIQEILSASLFKFYKSAVNDIKAIAIRSKVSFFKNSMIIHRGEDFQIAVKSTEVTPLEIKRISIYINNKSATSKPASIQYKYDPAYYELNVSRKLSTIEKNSQGKEQVIVKLINFNDLDSIIEAKLTINGLEVVFFLPAMFLTFLEKRPIFQKNPDYDTQKVVPINQFSSLHSAAECIPLEKLYGQRYESGRVYAISKSHEAYIYFRWSNGQVEIETIPAWRIFLSYLMFREY